MTDELVWSPYTKKSCSICLPDGVAIGFGSHVVFDVVPGAWNIFWLTFAQLDQLSNYKGKLADYIVTCDALAVCTGAALQVVGNRTLGSLAVSMTPRKFIEEVKGNSSFLPLVFYGEIWLKVARARASTYTVLPDNVIRGNFGRSN